MRSFIDSRTAILQEESTRAVLQSHVEPTEDIAAERQKATFDVASLKYFMTGGKKKYEKKFENAVLFLKIDVVYRVAFCDLVQKTDWGDKSQRYFVSREEEYVNALKAAFGIWDTVLKHGLDLKDAAMIRKLVNAPGGLELHIGMFIPALMGQASPEQQSKWLTMAQDLSIIGTYAQTELGHGTFVRGLQTTATYDAETEEFIVHTPTETATKWWPGGLGKTATHVVLMARLFIRGKDYGPHGFIVQIRSMDTHRPLNGITVGDIGPKFGYNAVDNGFLSFNHVRIPRNQMLMRFAKVHPDGSYIQPPPSNTKASYATMIYVRSTLVEDAGVVLAKAATVSVRYCSVRRQSASKPGMKETQLIDYQNVGATLIPVMATAYVLHFTGIQMMQMYRSFEKNRDRGDFAILPELHALSSGLKAICTWEAVEGIEKCRFCCGGHGYSRLSGLPDLYASYVQNPTWEGDNDVLCLQTGRYLLKAAYTWPEKSIQGSAQYLALFKGGTMSMTCPVREAQDWLSHQTCLKAFQFRAAYLVSMADKTVRSEAGGKLVFDGTAWNDSTVAVIRCAVAHSWCSVLSTALEAIHDIEMNAKLPQATVDVLHQCITLFALTKLQKHADDLLESGYLAPHQIQSLRSQAHALVKSLRPNAVALVDGFGYLDYELNSALGRADGDVYKGLLEMARASPLNKTEEGPAWHAVLAPRMRPKARM